MDPSPFKPKPAIPFHLTNGPSPLSGSTEARDKKEKDSLYAQIQNSNRGRQVVNFDGPKGYFPKSSTSANLDGSNGRERHQIVLQTQELNVTKDSLHHEFRLLAKSEEVLKVQRHTIQALVGTLNKLVSPEEMGKHYGVVLPNDFGLGTLLNSSLQPFASYVQRPALHERLRRHSHHVQTAQAKEHPVCVVWRLGGAGKSQLIPN
ncbi:MAG: hypothetical protein L6R38_000774 [Xanthoria sp. 2 TBL-2021]|nr:MAG: hypothetical protein L6R38_000774 [Xanthoria sp. 2 TBL-2021]